HTAQMRAAITAGLHVFCEKPISVTALDKTELPYLLRSAQEKGLVVSTCHPRRFDPPFLHIKKMLPQWTKSFGELKHFDFSFFYHEVTDEWKKDRSLLSDHYGHEIDILAYLCKFNDFKAQKQADSHDFYEVVGQADSGL